MRGVERPLFFPMKILNLYACLGGNRYKWGNEHNITAVEWDEELAKLYQERFPNDKVIVADAHQYLLDHYKEFDFIWSSPPCPTHSTTNWFLNAQGVIRYPDMKLYEEIILLKSFYKGKYVVENVKPYYEPLIAAEKRGRHLYWTNFKLPLILSSREAPNMNCNKNITKKVSKDFAEYHKINEFLKKYRGKQDRGKIARNLVDYEAGKTILDAAMGVITRKNVNQIDMFENEN